MLGQMGKFSFFSPGYMPSANYFKRLDDTVGQLHCNQKSAVFVRYIEVGEPVLYQEMLYFLSLA